MADQYQPQSAAGLDTLTEPAAPLKPLLNPLQNDGPAPLSTTVEPPHSPNALNPAVDSNGNSAVHLNPTFGISAPTDAPAPESVVAPIAALLEQAPVPAPVVDLQQEPTPQPSPLPVDAPVSPTPPRPLDEVPPALPESAIPPAAVSPPTVISLETPAPLAPPTPADTPAPQETSSAPVPIPTPAVVETALPTLPSPAVTPAPVECTLAPAPAPDPTPQETLAAPVESVAPPVEHMDVDQTVPEPALVSSLSTDEVSLKRSGDELVGPQEKRVRDEASVLAPQDPAAVHTPAPAPEQVPEAAAPTEIKAETLAVPTPVPAPGFQPSTVPAVEGAPLIPTDPSLPPPPWVTYAPPAPRPSGPTTPLTITQHKHLLSSIRSLKKMKEAGNFLEPVDVVRFGIPHYAQIVTKPMDLSTAETKLVVSDPRGPPKDKSKLAKWDTSKGSYSSVSQVVEDVRQIWENTRKFNGPDHVVSQLATKLEASFERMLNNLPPEPSDLPASPATGSSFTPQARRSSFSQAPAIRRSSDGPDSRPKREIHPPPSKDLNYENAARKPKRRNDPQLQWVARTLKGLESTNKHYNTLAPFLYPVQEIINALPSYTTVIKKPIDLLIIKSKLDEGAYDDVFQADADIRLLIRNAQTFNPPNDPVYIAAVDFLNLWNDKWKSLPPKQEIRDASEDPLADDFIDGDESDEEDAALLAKLEGQLATVQSQIAEIRARRTARRNRKSKPKASKPRKQSANKASPGGHGNGYAKKARKSSTFKYDEDADSEEEAGQMTLAQKQELADKIQHAGPDVLERAIALIQQTTNLGANGEEIELDIDSLPPRTIMKLYNLVVRGIRSNKSKGQALKKTGRKATGGTSRKFMNEDEEADRIRRMEAQLQSFDSGRPSFGYEDEGESSEEESSDED